MSETIRELLLQNFALISSQWLSLKLLVHLDSALSNHSVRNEFIKLLTKLNLDEMNIPLTAHCSYLNWLVERNVPVLTINLLHWLPTSTKSTFTRIVNYFGFKKSPLSKWAGRTLPRVSKSLVKLHLRTPKDKTIDVGDFTWDVVRAIGQCIHLRQLTLESFTYRSLCTTAASLEPLLQGCKHLTQLSLLGCHITESDIKLLSTEMISFSYKAYWSPNLSQEALVALIERCPKLQSLCIADVMDDVLREVPLFNTAVYEKMARFLPDLRELTVDSTGALCGFEILLSRCPSLRKLNYGNCSHISFDDLANLLLHKHSQLSHLSLCGSVYYRFSGTPISDFDEVRFQGRKSHLQHLTLLNFVNLEESGLQHVLRCCPELRSLKLAGIPRLSADAVVDMILQYCPHIQLVEAWKCFSLSSVREQDLIARGVSVVIEMPKTHVRWRLL